jgi:type II secretion system protein H
MTLPIGNNRASRRRSNPGRPGAAFTLVELMLVMALLVIMLGFAAPSLSHFFRGRNLDSEARRLLALTRYGQSRAVSEGYPMLLWIDPQQRTYGLKAQTGFVDQDQKAVEYTLAQDLQLEVQASSRVQSNFWTLAPQQTKLNQPTICFLPDGFISETSPDRILLRETRDNDAVWIAETPNRLAYEIETNQPPRARN